MLTDIIHLTLQKAEPLEFIQDILANPALLVTVILTIGVILVNGWTDAPNAIATCISTRAIKPKNAILMAAVCNFLGVFVMTLINKSVAMTISNMVDFGTDTRASSIALSGALASIVIWATAAWYFGIPTSESHALIAGLTGAAVAYFNGFQGINGAEWMKVVFGLILSTFGGFFLGWGIAKLLELIFKHEDRRKTNKIFRKQIIGDDDDLLETDEMFRVVLNIRDSTPRIAINKTAVFSIEIKPDIGASLLLQKHAPPGLSADSYYEVY